MNQPQTTPSTVVNIEKGKIPPQAVDLEVAVLGAIMLHEKSLEEVFNLLAPEIFYKDAHGLIYDAIRDLYLAKEPIDLLTVSAQLKKRGNLESVGGDFYLIKLTQQVGSSAHIEFHSRIVIQKYMARQIIKMGSEAMGRGYDDSADIFETMDELYDQMNAISMRILESKEVKLSELVPPILERGIKIFQGEIPSGIDTPISLLSERTGGWRSGELIILAARPGMGKTSFALSCALEPARKEIPVAIFSLEMSKEVLGSRMISMETEIDGSKFNSSGLSPEDLVKIQNARENIDKLPIWIEDSHIGTIELMQLKAKKMKAEHGIQLFIIDYLQLMSGDGKSREQEISKISRSLKIMSKELDVPIIALSQLSRAVESRSGSKRPQLSDLRESGSIEQDADVVMFIYRPEYYNEDNWDDYGGRPCHGEAEYLVAKNRNGGLVRNRMKFEAKFTKFSDLDPDEDDELLLPLGDDDTDTPF